MVFYRSVQAHSSRRQGRIATIDAATRLTVIDGALEHLKTAYVFPETATKMADAIRARVQRKEYDNITSARAFADALTKDIQEVSHDKHLRVIYTVDPLPERRVPSPEDRARAIAEERRRNFAFERVERLDGNVGYIDLRGFSGSPEASETAVAAMNFLAGTDALIFDLTRNGGGSPAMIGLLSSYLFDDVVHLNDFYWRESNETRQFWTSPHVQGQRYGGSKPVYILTSLRTFSAAEEFTYNLKNLKRATIVGETTGGGAHPGGTADHRSLRNLGPRRPRDQPDHQDELGGDGDRAAHQGRGGARARDRAPRCAEENQRDGERQPSQRTNSIAPSPRSREVVARRA